MTLTGIITQARMTSTRLPGKVLMRAGGKTMLGHHLTRLLETGLPIVVATSDQNTDDPIVEEAQHYGVEIFRGSELDVLSRFALAAEAFEFTDIIRVTSDCPLIDPDLILEGLFLYRKLPNQQTYVSNTLKRTYPRGMDFEIFSASLLADANRFAQTGPQREHVTPWIYQNVNVRVIQLQDNNDFSDIRITLDTVEDWALLKELFTKHNAQEMPAHEVKALFQTYPELFEFNKGVEQKKL